MNIPINFKAVELKDIVWAVGAVCAVVGSWFVMGQDIDHIRDQQDKQQIVDARQDEVARIARTELILIINRQSDEIKQEIRDLRSEISRLKR